MRVFTEFDARKYIDFEMEFATPEGWQASRKQREGAENGRW